MNMVSTPSYCSEADPLAAPLGTLGISMIVLRTLSHDMNCALLYIVTTSSAPPLRVFRVR